MKGFAHVVIFVALFFTISVLFDDAHAISVTITDETSCESIPNAIWSTSPDTCTVTTNQTIASGESWTTLPYNTPIRLVVNPNVNVTNSGTITIDLFTNYGTIENNGYVSGNYQIGYLDLINYGIINNSGIITDDVGTITNYNTIDNSGSFNIVHSTILGTPNPVFFHNSGTLNNSGNVTFAGAIVNNNSGGIINNSGSISSNDGYFPYYNEIFDSIINNYSTINNNLGGTITNNGVINNNDIINNQCGATYTGSPPNVNPINYISCDTDNDGINDIVDNCPFNSNPLQEDTDNDGIGDVCDSDDDNDTILDGVDSCPTQPETINNYQDTDGCPDITPAEAITNLITLGNSYGTNTKVLSTIDLNNNSAACGKLNAFINQVNANNTLTSFQKAQLIQSANTIKASIGC